MIEMDQAGLAINKTKQSKAKTFIKHTGTNNFNQSGMMLAEVRISCLNEGTY